LSPGASGFVDSAEALCKYNCGGVTRPATHPKTLIW